MKRIAMQNDGHFTVFTCWDDGLPKVRKQTNMNTATRVIRPDKGGGYERKEKFRKSLTTE
jgi:hypothetical protein